MIKFFLFALIVSSGYYYNFHYDDPPVIAKNKSYKGKEIFLLKDFSHLRETLFTNSQVYLEVNLKLQNGKMIFRDGAIKEFFVSSGTEKLKDGMETNSGLFVIQSKEKKWHSRQFDSTLMLNWMGFNYGIGFHALANNVYYNYLGKKRSSHGCIRISREDALLIYDLVELGTPVLVHNGESALTIGFAEPGEFYHYFKYGELGKVISERLKYIYDGKYFFFHKTKLLIEKSNVHHLGLVYGDNSKIPQRQYKPYASLTDLNSTQDKFFHYVQKQKFLIEDKEITDTSSVEL